jgi:hypothetical protein
MNDINWKEAISMTEALERTPTSRATLISWCRKYVVDNEPLGIKVGGRWRVFPDRLVKFLEGRGTKDND